MQTGTQVASNVLRKGGRRSRKRRGDGAEMTMCVQAVDSWTVASEASRTPTARGTKGMASKRRPQTLRAAPRRAAQRMPRKLEVQPAVLFRRRLMRRNEVVVRAGAGLVSSAAGSLGSTALRSTGVYSGGWGSSMMASVG